MYLVYSRYSIDDGEDIYEDYEECDTYEETLSRIEWHLEQSDCLDAYISS